MIIQCPHCQRELELKEEFLGKLIRCPLCRDTFTANESSQLPQLPTEGVTAANNPPPVPKGPEPREQEPRERERELDSREPRDPPRRRRERRRDDDDWDDFDRRYRNREGMEPDRGSTILVLGILSLLVCGPVLGPIAWIMGSSDLSAMREGRMDPIGEGNTRAGQVCGMIATILSLIGLVFACIWMAFLFAAAGAAR